MINSHTPSPRNSFNRYQEYLNQLSTKLWLTIFTMRVSVTGGWHTECFLYFQTASTIFAMEKAAPCEPNDFWEPTFVTGLTVVLGCALLWRASGGWLPFSTCAHCICLEHTHVLKSGPELSEEACFLEKWHQCHFQVQVSRDVAVIASLRSREIK